MRERDAELDKLREVSCAALIERWPQGWKLDRRGSTRNALKYRRGEGEIIIVNHHGRGWWDPLSDGKGDVFDLVQHLDSSLSFGQVRKVLRPFVGLEPTYPEALRDKARPTADQPIADRWASKPRISNGCSAWEHLTVERGLPIEALEAARAGDAIRQGAYGSAWFAHRDVDRAVCHVEVRGADFKGSLRGGRKTLFRLRGGEDVRRLVIAEAPIDALSVAALERLRGDTDYVATGGGMGPSTVAMLAELIGGLAGAPGGAVLGATDANAAGDRFAEHQRKMAASAGVAFERLRPPEGLDWNDVLKTGNGA